MSLIDHFLSRLAPYDCLSCSAEGRLICNACKLNLPVATDRCYRCYRLSSSSLTCNDCLTPVRPASIKAATIYKGVAKDILWKLKSGGAQSAAREMAGLMMPLIGPHVVDLDGQTSYSRSVLLVAHLPTATTRVRQRGYDQARLLARALAKQARLPYADVLARSGQAHQVGASRAERLVQLENAFRVTGAWQIRDRHILLVDDVLTTGASFEAATMALKAAGAAQVYGVAFARV